VDAKVGDMRHLSWGLGLEAGLYAGDGEGGRSVFTCGVGGVKFAN
jgi:hypothetical protein